MSGNDYHFVSTWRAEATCGEVADVIGDASALTRWWPAVYLRAEEIEPADARGVGRRVAVITKGWLPYTLCWELRVVESRYPHGLTIAASGDFNGTGVWTFEQDGRFVVAIYDWTVRAEKPLLRNLSGLLRPIFEANHRWAMAQGEESLRLELERRRATSDEVRGAVPPPPGPTTYAGVAVLAGVVVIGASLTYLMVRAGRRSR